MLHMVCFTVSQNLFNTLSAVYVWAYDHDVQGIYVPPTPHADSNYTQKKKNVQMYMHGSAMALSRGQAVDAEV